MRLTIDIDESILLEIQKYTGIKKKSPAVFAALRYFCKNERKRKFLKRVLNGKTDYHLTNEELEAANYDIN